MREERERGGRERWGGKVGRNRGEKGMEGGEGRK